MQKLPKDFPFLAKSCKFGISGDDAFGVCDELNSYLPPQVQSLARGGVLPVEFDATLVWGMIRHTRDQFWDHV